MITWAKIIAGVVGLFNAFAQWQAREQAKADGAAIQRAHDLEAENERIAKAGRAADAIRNGGGVSEQDDPHDRDNQ